jgi:hypothetical protein
VTSQNGQIAFFFSDGTAVEMPSQAAVDSLVNVAALEASIADSLKLYIMGWSGLNVDFQNKTITFDLNSPSGNIISIQ